MTTQLMPSAPHIAAERGPLSALTLQIVRAGRRGTGAHEELAPCARHRRTTGGGVVHDDDVQLTLFLLYGLHYGWLGPLGDELEWDLELLGVRQELEAMHEAELRHLVGDVPVPHASARAVARALRELTSADKGPSLARHVARRASLDQARELLVLRSIYTLREADAHSWAIPG